MKKTTLDFCNVRFEFDEVKAYRKVPNKYILRENARWGPKWLHRLVIRVAINLGMVGNMVDAKSERFLRETVDFADKTLIDTILNVLNECDYSIDEPLMVLIGQDQFDQLVWELRDVSSMVIAPISRSKIYGEKDENRLTVMGMPVRVLPYFSGIAVVPIEAFPSGVEVKTYKRP